MKSDGRSHSHMTCAVHPLPTDSYLFAFIAVTTETDTPYTGAEAELIQRCYHCEHQNQVHLNSYLSPYDWEWTALEINHISGANSRCTRELCLQ